MTVVLAMEYTSRWLSLVLVLVTALLLSCACAPGSAEITLAQQYVVPQSHLRAIHDLRPLKWSNGLAEQAARWAARFKGNCAAAAAASAGVNVFRGSGGATWQPSDAVAAWAEQAQNYDYGSGTCAPGMQCAQYKQVVWRGSTDVGCATVECASGETLMTCHYAPLGNIMGQRPF